MQTRNVFVLAAVAALVAGAASAQTTVFVNADRIDDAIEDLRDDIDDDFDRDIDAFGNEGRPQGFNGSLAARTTRVSGNKDTTDIGVGANVNYFDGLNGHEFQMSYAYSKDTGNVSDETLLLGYEYKRNLNSAAYIYSKALHALDFTAVGTEYERDTFIGAGFGYYVLNDSTSQWSIAAGPGWRWTEDANGLEDDQVAASIASDFSYRVNETTLITNDTDVIWSEDETTVLNDLGINISMTDALALRTSVLTDYTTEPAVGSKSTTNTFGVSLVYSFK